MIRAVRRLRSLMFLTLLLPGCPGPPAPPEAPGSRCAYGLQPDGSCATGPDEFVDVPPLERKQIVTTTAPATDFDVEAVPAGAAGWTVRVTSKVDGVASIIWDESTFVTSDGQSAGRLIMGQTRKLDAAKSQPNTPLAPRSNTTQVVLVEKLLDAEETAGGTTRARAAEIDEIESVRTKLHHILVGGKLYVTVQGPSGKHTWVGTVTETE